VVCLFAIGTSLLLAWRSVSPTVSRVWVILLLTWHFVLMILWVAVVGVLWSEYHNHPGYPTGRTVLLAAGVFGILDFLLWFATVVMGCVGFCCGGRSVRRKDTGYTDC
jgi:hypothetical protein